MTNATIENNDFLDSTAAASGHIIIVLNAGERAEARIADNQIVDGAGFGILCSDRGGTFLLTDLMDNNFGDNEKGDISGCPWPDQGMSFEVGFGNSTMRCG